MNYLSLKCYLKLKKMSTKRVTKITAELAQQKGFDVHQNAYCWVKTLNGEIMHNSERRDIPEHNRFENILMQPTLFGLAEWLRDEHFLHVKVDRNIDGWCFSIIEFKNGNKAVKVGTSENSSYDSELEIGLQEALKLITS